MARYRSFFWPALLVLVGVAALLVNTGVITADRLATLFDLWPVILIVIGLEIIVRTTTRGVVADVAALSVVLIAVVGALAYVVEAPSIPGYAANQTLDVSDTAGSLTHASLEVDAGAATITLAGDSSLGSDLYRAHVQYSGQKPTITLDRASGSLKISQDNSGFNVFRHYKFVMNLALNPHVAWSVTENTGASDESLNFSTLSLDSLTINTGASREDITLGAPSGHVSITINGGALTAHVHRPSGTEASVDVSGGAISLDADGRQQHAVGSVSYQSSGFSGASAAYQVTINGGACTVTLDTSGSG